MSPKTATLSLAETFRRWWPVLAAAGLGVGGYFALRQRVADAETSIVKLDQRMDAADAHAATDHDAITEIRGDVRWLVCDKDPKQCRGH